MSETVGIWCRVHQESARAIEIEDDSGRRHWLPKSQLADLPDRRHWHGPVLLDVSAWLAEREGLV